MKADNQLANQERCILNMIKNGTGGVTIQNDFNICLQKSSSSSVSEACINTTRSQDNTTTLILRVSIELLTVVLSTLEDRILHNREQLCGVDTLIIEIRSGVLPMDRTTADFCQQNVHENVVVNNVNLTLEFLFGELKENYSYYAEFVYEIHNSSFVRRLITDECEICDGKIISASEYQRRSYNGKRSFISIGTFHSDENFELEDGSVFLCDEILEPGERPLFSSVPGGLELAQGLAVLSLIALLLTFITYCYFSKLRNVPGKIIMNLLVALFLALSSICIEPLLHFPDSLCLTSAIVFHYFWLAAFVWMNILSIDTTYILSCRPFSPIETSSGRYRLCMYYAYGWGGPGMFVLVCIALHYCKCSSFGFEYGYDDGICWPNDGKSGLYFFGVPVAILLSMNVILLCITVGTIWRSSRGMKKSRKQTDKFAASRREFMVFIKVTGCW